MTQPTTTYMIQAILGDAFEDIYVEAVSVDHAIDQARRLTTLQSRWTRFVA